MTEIKGKSILVRVSVEVRVTEGSSYRESTVLLFLCLCVAPPYQEIVVSSLSMRSIVSSIST